MLGLHPNLRAPTRFSAKTGRAYDVAAARVPALHTYSVGQGREAYAESATIKKIIMRGA